MTIVIRITGKARQVFKAWNLMLSKLGNLTLGQLQEYQKQEKEEKQNDNRT